ncbi:unnamed protein product [Parascedosporium putredinis]|uniref:Vacuolar protein sorting/targeting protein 10 n=1 Tax=Parascedosporium putredinis TaxID=1442378 RepID=A0A9P1H655_9PEZI|nr:unnamed protein product [Parascedosporium putredinis]CAI7998412.1 unnamed protein product [Parascedosporium putredinis]
MRFRGKAAASWRSLLLSSLLWTAAFAKSDTPTMSVSSFENPPRSLRYFRGSDDVLFHDPIERVVYRSVDAGTTWHKIEGVPAGAASALIMHTYDSSRAFILGRESDHYRTNDNGKTWHKFTSASDATFSETERISDEVLSFHAGDPDRIIFNGVRCKLFLCALVTTYTTDGFESPPKDLRQFATGCWWAKSAPEFTTGDDELDANRVLCIVEDGFTMLKEDQRLVISDNFFHQGKEGEFEPSVGSTKGIIGAVNIASVKKFILVATTSLRTDEMALYVSTDTKTWHRAMFPESHGHTINQGSYTVLESTNYSIQIDVMNSRPSSPMGVLFTSNSDGTYFTENVEYTNRNEMGLVDFEKISSIQGVFLVNTVKNGEELQKHSDRGREVVTEITFDDGRTFEKVMAKDKRIHLHSVTQLLNLGRVYSSPAPGLVMGNGNTGDHLKSLSDADLYVSDNAGVSWKKALDGPHKYDFGDQGSILVAVKHSTDGEETVSDFSYSLDHGDNWKRVSLPDKLEIVPSWLTTTQDSSTLKFLLLGRDSSRDGKYHMVSIDFDGLHERTCGDKDIEEWHARADSEGHPTCIMGHKQTFQRRKKDAECFIKKEFKEAIAKKEPCECADHDFECDFNFVRDDDKKCGQGRAKDDLVERKCSDVVGGGPPSGGAGDGEIVEDHYEFKTEFETFQKFYLERGDSSQRDDESLIVRPVRFEGSAMIAENKLWRTSDHGKKWERILEDQKIKRIYPHPTFNDVLFFTTDSEKAPLADEVNQLSFHPNKKDWIIAIVEKCDDSGKSCYREAHLSKNRGDDWDRILHHVVKCEFTGGDAFKMRSEKQIICLAQDQDDEYAKENRIFVSDDFFAKDVTNPKLIGDSTEGEASHRNYATMSEFVVAAAAHDGMDGLVAFASVNGKNFAQAKFPVNLKADHSTEYTILDSSTHAVNMFIPTETAAGRRYGNILKSNSNGTSYVLSASGVNCNDDFYVDYEKIPGLEGTKVTYNDGSEWYHLAPPAKDVEGKSFSCSSAKGDSSCALHLHGFTERIDKKRTYSVTTAVGLMFGWGNVGSHLGPLEEADTFMTTDGGITWKQVQKGVWTWQYGDQGSLTVLVQQRLEKANQKVKTDHVLYSTDEGETWKKHKFSEGELVVYDITAPRSGSSRNFILWASKSKGQPVAINLDFSGLTSRPCEESDYYTWTPQDPSGGLGCLFGHKSKYLRKSKKSECYNDGRVRHELMVENCECARRDFECAYNYELDGSGQCSLVPGLSPLSVEEWCKLHPDEPEYYEPTGYRRIPLTTCEGGRELDKSLNSQPCKGHEEEYEKRHKVSGVVIFFAVTIPFALAGAAGWWVWRNWKSQFGQIRLGEPNAFNSEAPWVRYPVIAVSAAVALVAALPLVATSLWRAATSTYQRVGGGGGGGGGGASRSWFSRGPRRFTTRDSFARGMGDYADVDDVEGELLGDDSDEDI